MSTPSLMAASPSPNKSMGGKSATSITCQTCDSTVKQAPGSRRTICPHCGNFYDPEAARIPPQPPRGPKPPRHTQEGHSSQNYNRKYNKDKLPKLARDDKEKSGTRLQSIANFFQNLNPNRRDRSSRSGNNSDHDGSRTSSADGGSRTELPPINSEKGRLTVDRSPVSSHSNPDSPNTPNTPTQNHQKTFSYPVRNKTVQQLRDDVKQSRESANWKDVHDFYATTFDSFLELNAAFKRDPQKEYKTTDDPGLKFDFVTTVYELLSELPQEIQKVVLKAVINSLLKDKRPHTKEDLRAYLILVQNPQFSNIATYVIFAHLLRQMAALSDHDHHFLVHWFRKLRSDQFQSLAQRLHNFISCRLFPPKPKDLPPMSKCTWWIPSATKVMALLNASNNLTTNGIINYTDFYNHTLDHLDLMAEYYAWQNPSTHPGFTFCQYPFILSINAKRTILQKDSEQQMIIMARRSLVAKVQRRQLPDIGMLFLNLTVRRSHLVSDSLNEIARKQHDLKKKLKVTFSGEPGLDMGGLTKEWFLLLVRQIFQPEYGMFTYDKTSRVFWFSTTVCENYQEFNLVGVLMGLAVYNSIILDIHFPACCYKKLLSPAVVPYNNPRATVGVTNVTLDDLEEVLPDLVKGLRDLLAYEGDVEDDFGLTFQISITEYGNSKTHVLKPGGETINVTNKNRREYVNLYSDWLLNKSVYPQFQAFYHGFHSVCASNALIMLRPEEVETLVCGCPNLDLDDLRKVTQYDGYTVNDSLIKHFWEICLAFPVELQKKLLLFTTGSDRVPIGGMMEMQFKITRVENTDMLPVSHTCFNQLVLPHYKTKKVLKQKLTIAIQNAEGFGME
ncbi:probable E3 ubiquitin-protein ligase HECTD2 isoform X2 [Lineus longissimus]|uniref:probable E3 ubiquitin-protein ligase HECTD2 isoform X2 n=1 Tax=Lineus longissimus TaxID=88925 RepID=UPI002B4C4D24